MKYLIVGLGNPGTEYAKTRHNAGWIVIDEMFPNLEWGRDTYASGGTAFDSVAGADITFLKPATFMNDSGLSVNYFIAKKGFSPDQCIVIYDDIDLPVGSFKISFDRGSGGHNGIKSIEEHVGSREFIRIRIGISRLIAGQEPAGTGIGSKPELLKPNVLGHFESSEMETLKKLAPTIKAAFFTIITEGKEKAMTEFNSGDPHIRLPKV